MKIAICVKHVPMDGNVEVDPVTHKILRENAECDINSCDLNAMEMAAQLKKSVDATIDVFTMGADMASYSLKKCMALGADEAYLVSDRKFAGSDTLGTARVLAGALAKVAQYDVVFCGSESSDGATGQVGPMLAEALNMANVPECVAVEQSEDGKLLVKQKVEGGYLKLKVTTPVLLTVPFGCNEPARPTIRLQMKANKRPITTFSQNELALAENEIGMDAALSIVTDVVAAPERKAATILEGDAANVAAQIKALLEQRRG